MVIIMHILNYCYNLDPDERIEYRIFMTDTDYLDNFKLIEQRIKTLRNDKTAGFRFDKINE